MDRQPASGLSPQITRATVTSWALVSFLAAYTGPFGTYAIGFGHRLLYWSLVVVCASVIAQLCRGLALRVAYRRAWIWRDLLTIGLMAVLFSPVVWGITRVLLTGSSAPVPGIWVFVQYVAIMTVVITVARRAFPGPGLGGAAPAPQRSDTGVGAAPEDPADSDPEPELPRLARRLPDDFQGPILRLTVNDHCVDVVTRTATHRIRLRFADAIDEMDTVAGYCTHRSHWVARQAIAGVEREAGRIMLRLINGDQVPVSRTYRPQLESAGLI